MLTLSEALYIYLVITTSLTNAMITLVIFNIYKYVSHKIGRYIYSFPSYKISNVVFLQWLFIYYCHKTENHYITCFYFTFQIKIALIEVAYFPHMF